MLWLVPSPRWLTLCGRQAEASAVWDILGVSHAEREKIEDLQDSSTIPLEVIGTGGFSSEPDIAALGTDTETKTRTFFDVFSVDVRARTALAAFMMGMQQLSGIDGVLYVSFYILRNSLL